jgi:hypothetical protein
VTKIGDFIVDFLHEFEAIVKKALPVYQGPTAGSSLMNNTRGQKSVGPFAVRKKCRKGAKPISLLFSL